MKVITGFLLSVVVGLSSNVGAQGIFGYANVAARTRIIDANGPFAGTNIYAQMLAGPTADSLQPVGPVAFHIDGFVHAGRVAVPGVPPYQEAFAQMAAWDSTYWGESLSGVPEGQLGRTDIVAVFLTNSELGDPFSSPRFTQPAVVPPIPEPSVWTLALLGGILRLSRFRRRWTVTR